MNETEEFSSLIDMIYNAAVTPALWTEVIEQTTQFLGGVAGAMVMGYPNCLDKQITYSFGCDAGYKRLYDRKYRNCSDLWRPLSSHLEVGEIFNAADARQIALKGSCLHQEFHELQETGDNFVCVLERSPDSYAAFGLLSREEDSTRDAILRRMRLTMPHLRRALLIGKAIQLSNAETATFTDVLDGLRAGVFLLDARQRLLYVNESGRMMLAEGVLFKAASGRLTAEDPEGARDLEKGVATAANADGTGDIQNIAVLLRARSNGRYIAYLSPLTFDAAGAKNGAVAALFVRKADGEISSSSEIIAKHYNLTPTEKRVLIAMVEAGSVPEIAGTLGVARSTVKTHLHRMFAKTNTQRQADLIKLLAAFSNPLTR
jgi:DNA-binding CsgD family transcriptional regulator